MTFFILNSKTSKIGCAVHGNFDTPAYEGPEESLNKINIFAGGVEADGMWQAVFVTFLVYAMMPLKTWVALAFSTIIAATHMSVSALLTTNQKIGLHWQQVRLKI